MEIRSERPPEVDYKTAAALVAKRFPFKHVTLESFRNLPSYYDRNIYFEGVLENSSSQQEEGGEEEGYVLKVSSLSTPPEIIEGLNSQMLFLSSKGFPCCYPIASRSGRYTPLASESELLGVAELGDARQVDVQSCVDVKYPVRVMKFIAGEIMDQLDEKLLSPELCYSVGKMAGRMDVLLEVSVSSFVLQLVLITEGGFSSVLCCLSIVAPWIYYRLQVATG